MRRLPRILIGVAVAAAISVATIGPAGADPEFSPAADDIVGVGSDTTQNVIDAVADQYNTEHPTDPQLASWDAFTDPASNIVPTAKDGCPVDDPDVGIARPNGSSAGINALLNDTAKECFDFARSSRPRGSNPAEANLTFYPFARDLLVWGAHDGDTTVPASLTRTQLRDIYLCNITTFPGTSDPVHAYAPQPGSGTRAVWLTSLGITAFGSCVNDSIQENRGDQLPAQSGAIMPYSGGVWIAQEINGLDDHSGDVTLHQIGGVAPLTASNTLNLAGYNPNPDTAVFIRSVFNVVRNSDTSTLDDIFGNGGWLCTDSDADDLVELFGFVPLPNVQCGVAS